MANSEFENLLYREIPLSRHLAVRALEVSAKRVRLAAPLAPNRNYKSTVFGGSIYSVAVLSCWSLVSQLLKEEGLPVDYVVIQDGAVEYSAPVGGDFTAEAAWPNEDEIARFLGALKRRGLARVSLGSVVRVGGTECAKFTGRFVAQLKGR